MWLQNGKKDSPFGDNPMNIQLKRFQVTVVIVVVGVEQTFSWVRVGYDEYKTWCGRPEITV